MIRNSRFARINPSRSIPRVTPVRFSHTYNYNYNYNVPKKRSKLVWLGIPVLIGSLYYFYWPKHTFPSSVAKILRKGLWAESDKGENDFQLALKHYIEALNKADEVGLNPISDEYTGIQLKICEMLERLNKFDEAQFIYNEIATNYLLTLTSKPGTKEFAQIKNSFHRQHLIQKDLRIAIKLVEYNKHNKFLSKSILLTHLIVAFDEINTQISTLPSNNQFKMGNFAISLPNSTFEFPFMDELLNAMDLYQAICISTGDLNNAVNINFKMLQYSMISKEPVFKIIKIFCNIGSLFYLQAEELELQKFNLQKTPNPNPSVIEEVSKNHENFLNLAINSYKMALQPNNFNASYQLTLPNLNDNISPMQLDQYNLTTESLALATYGLGVTYLHMGNYELAEKFLRESRVKSKSCNYEDLLPEIERELNKLFNEKKLKNQNVEMNILMKK